MSRDLSRRTVLRGLGTAIALPWMEAMSPAFASTPVPRRFVSVFLANGVPGIDWRPFGVGATFRWGRASEPLEAIRGRLRVLSGLANPVGRDTHEPRTRAALSPLIGEDETAPEGVRLGRSLDRRIADAVSGGSSLVLGSETVTGCPPPGCGTWLDRVSWEAENVPSAKDVHVGTVFDRLFGADDPGALPPEVRRAVGGSVLDNVREDAGALARRLGTTDRARLDEYLSGIRALELGLDASDACDVARPVPADDYVTHIDQMMDLIVAALRCDRARVVSYMPAVALSQRMFPQLGTPMDHHTASHEDPIQHTTMTRWYVERFVELVQRLDAVEEADGRSLLDHSHVVLFGGIGDGRAHSDTGLPVVLAGSGGGQPSDLGHHLTFPEGTPVARLWLSLLQAFDPTARSFGELADAPLLDLG